MLACFALCGLKDIPCPSFWLLQSWNRQCDQQSCLEFNPLGLRDFFFFCYAYFWGDLRKEKVLVLFLCSEFLFTGACRGEQKLEVKTKGLTEYRRRTCWHAVVQLVCQLFHFSWYAVTPLLWAAAYKLLDGCQPVQALKLLLEEAATR